MARGFVWHARKTALSVVLVTAVATFAACGDDGSDDVRTAFVGLQAQFADHDAAGVCDRISRRAQRQVGSLGHEQPTTCQRDIRRLFKWITTPRAGAAPTAADVEVDGDRATVDAALTGYASSEVPFVRQDGQWKLDNFFGVTAPPPPDLQ